MAATKKSFSDKIWDFFCSLKLAIVLVLLISVASIIGTVLQQNAPAAQYISKYGQTNYELFLKFQLTDMYSSTWFVGMLALFSINLICCSIKNFPRVWKFATAPTLVASAGIFKGSANRGEFSAGKPKQEIADQLSVLLKKEFAKTTLTETDGQLHLFAQKGIYSRFGAYITHLSILTILAGAVIGNLWGYKAFVNIVEGTSVDQVRSRDGRGNIDLGFTVRCDDFHVSFYENTTRPKEYTSDLVILKNGQEVMHKTIEVNSPLKYDGIMFYQSSYGPTGKPFFEVKVTENATGETIEFKAPQGDQIQLPGGYSFAVTDYTDSDRNFGPAMRMHIITPDGKHGAPFVVWKDYPLLDVKREGVFSFALIEHNQTYYTGLQVAKDPGVNVVWAGCLMMLFGSVTAFFVSHRRIWIRLEDDGKNTKITVAGNAHRNQPNFSLDFEALLQKIELNINTESPQKEG